MVGLVGGLLLVEQLPDPIPSQLEQLYIAHFTNHRLRFVTEWVVGVILLQIGLKCVSMRMTLDLLHEFANAEVFLLVSQLHVAIQTL